MQLCTQRMLTQLATWCSRVPHDVQQSASYSEHALEMASTMHQDLDALLLNEAAGSDAEDSTVAANEWLASLPKAPFVG